MLRQRVQTVLASTLGAATRMSREGRVVVLCYHSVHPEKDFAVRPEAFDAQLAWLKRECRVIPFRDCLRAKREARPAVAITFDDGYADNFEFAFPLLAKHNLSATFFVTSGLLAKEKAVVEGFQAIRGTGYEAIRPLEFAQARQMLAAGQEFGAHTRSHPNLALLGAEAVRAELSESKKALEDALGARMATVAYPFGLPHRNFTAETMRVAEQCGYDMAAAVHFRPVLERDSRYAVPRFSILDEGLDVFAQKVRGNWDYLGWWQEKAPGWITRRAGGKQPVPAVN